MRKNVFLIVILFAVFCINVSLAHAAAPEPEKATKAVDVNKDGKPDVFYYGDGKNTTRIEADTNYDGKIDVVENVKDGKFQSAEIDTDKNGTLDKRVTNAAQFKKWVNQNSPNFQGPLCGPEGTLGAMDF